MRMLAAGLVVLLLSSVTSVTLAAGALSGFADIVEIRVGGGHVRVTGATPFNDPSNCTGSNTTPSLVILETSPSYKELVSLLLAAKLTGKPIQMWISGCAFDGNSSYPNGLYLYLN